MSNLALSVLIFAVASLTGFCKGENLCDFNSDRNVTSYRTSDVQNCGCVENRCIRKCCKAGFYLGRNRTCSRTERPLILPVYRGSVFSRLVSEKDIFKVGVLECSAYYSLVPNNPNDTYYVQEDGTLWIPAHSQKGFYKNSEYCVDQKNNLTAFICFDAEPFFKVLSREINKYGMIISMPFLLVTFLVYFLLPDRNLHQKALMFYVLSLLVAYILLVTINLTSGTYDAPWCSIFGYTTIFSFMVSFFWMNVICFDIWYTFSGGRGFAGSKRTSERKRLIVYGIYAFGMPALLLLVIYALQRILPETSAHNPGIGITKCFLADGWPNLWYFYGEAGLLVLANIIFFVLTALKIRKVKQETSMLKHSDSKRHSYEKDKQKFNLYLKLLFAMGVNWSMEVISWMVNFLSDSNYQYIFYLTDFFNAVYGVWIFFIFVFKKKIWTLLKKRYYNLIGKPHLAHTVTSMQTRTSNYSSTNYSTADTQLTDRGSAANGRQVPSEEMALRQVT